MTVANLENAMGDIVKLLQEKAIPDPPPARLPSKPVKINSPQATVTNHPTATATTNRLSYAESTW
jgi:hypothetical protein